jgi:hypothetical protein
MRYDLDKIRWQVLRDMGWTTTHPDTDVWIEPEGYVDPVSSGRLPDPAREAVDMLTVMRHFCIRLIPPHFPVDRWIAHTRAYNRSSTGNVVEDSAVLAVALRALLECGHDLKDFEVRP